MKKFQLKKGQELTIEFFTFPVKEDCTLVISGKDISQIYGNRQPSFSNYLLESPAIQLDSIDPLFGYSPEQNPSARYISTNTDIGGHYVYLDGKVIAFLSNGFGDGRYTLRFEEGKHYR